MRFSMAALVVSVLIASHARAAEPRAMAAPAGRVSRTTAAAARLELWNDSLAGYQRGKGVGVLMNAPAFAAGAAVLLHSAFAISGDGRAGGLGFLVGALGAGAAVGSALQLVFGALYLYRNERPAGSEALVRLSDARYLQGIAVMQAIHGPIYLALSVPLLALAAQKEGASTVTAVTAGFAAFGAAQLVSAAVLGMVGYTRKQRLLERWSVSPLGLAGASVTARF